MEKMGRGSRCTQDLKADKVKSTREYCHALPAPNDAWLGSLDCRYAHNRFGAGTSRKSRFGGGAAILPPPSPVSRPRSRSSPQVQIKTELNTKRSSRLQLSVCRPKQLLPVRVRSEGGHRSWPTWIYNLSVAKVDVILT